MAIQSYTSPIDVKWNTNNQGVKIKVPIYNEQHMIAQGYITLNQIPDYGDKVIIDELYEIEDGVPDESQFKVNYDMGIVNFHESHEAEVITIQQYSGRGIWSISSKKVYDDIEGQPIDTNQTLQDFINKVKEYQFEDFDPTKVYIPNKIVSYNGSTFICTKQTLNHEIPTNTEYWRVLVGGYIIKGDYDSNKTYEERDIVYYGIEKTLYECIQPAGLGISPYNTAYWKPIINAQTMLQQINDYTNDTTSLYVSHDMGITITHNLNDYPLPLVYTLGNGGYGNFGYGESGYGESNIYQVLAKAEYIDSNSIKLYLNEQFSGTPTITSISSTKYQVDFNDDISIIVKLK